MVGGIGRGSKPMKAVMGPQMGRVFWPERKAGTRSWRASNARLEGLVFLLRAGVSQSDTEQGEAGGKGRGTSRFGYNLTEEDQARVGFRPRSKMGPGPDASGALWASPSHWPGPWPSDPGCHFQNGAASPGPRCQQLRGCGRAGGG